MSIDLQVDNPLAMDQTELNSENETQINDSTTSIQTLTEVSIAKHAYKFHIETSELTYFFVFSHRIQS